ncbi:MAG: OB-fold nucleic acid binding domain-containing protein [Natronomonas sp.]|jgi:RecJ-like exonuclease|uniref:OB-fold nucleic acid binding domain-containing protein n=1 Tax=Natronomonas sp. TaxID=2184060 RepID=UPI00286FCD30|nr:OB-fold nucleic acid binding domain-containing protein [Natronomonas sp.]MDR9429964.1 OB-fold nucleic acid binding domain-containing protein [Natronomonas sp.]
MGNCIICGTSAEGPICEVHQEDVVFEFTGNQPSQLTPGRFYLGSVDGYADFGVFVNIGHVTGLLHRSKLDRRLESLDWEVGDEVCVQVNNVRDNGDIDLNWSIRQSPDDFRGRLVQTPEGDELPEEDDEDEPQAEPDPEPVDSTDTAVETAVDDEPEPDPEPDADADADTDGEPTAGEPGTTGDADEQSGGNPSDAELAELATDSDAAEAAAEAADIERVEIDSLEDRVGEMVRLEGTLASVRQTSGPTVFELRDETGIVDCAAFIEAGVRAYPDVDVDDVVQLDGEVQLRRGEIQVETESLVALDDEAQSTVETRIDDALEDRASPEPFEPIADDPEIAAVVDDAEAAATEIRRAVIESRPIVVRHDATADGYVAGAAIERAVLPLIEAEHGTADAVYHYFDRRPLEDGVYDMNDATKDVTRMLSDRDRHGETLPLFVFAAAGSTAASTDGLELLDIYDAPRVVLDGRSADEAVAERVASLVTVEDRTASTVAATLAAAVNGDVRDDVRHLPAVSYWADTPAVYDELAVEAGVDAEAAKQLRESIALEAYYQSYEDKRELIIDLLFEKRTGLAAQVSEQFVTKLDAELDTAVPNLDERTVDGVSVAVLDTDAYTHRYDFPPTRLLLDELSRRLDSAAVIGVGTDELHVRTNGQLDLGAVVAQLESAAPDAGIADPGAREPKIEFLVGERDVVIEAAVEAVGAAIATPSA